MKTPRATSLMTLLAVPTALLLTGAIAFGAPQPTPTPTPTPPPSVSGTIDLLTALKKGMDYSQELKQAYSQVKGAEDATAKARGALFPTINGVAQATNNQQSTTQQTASVGGFASSNVSTYALGLTLSQPLYVGGALSAGLDYYRVSEDLARQNYFNIKQTVVYNTLNSFFSLAQAQELLDAAESNRDILKSYVDITSYYERIGRARQMDKLQAQVNYSLALADVENDIGSLKVAYANMARYLGDPGDTQYKPNFKARINPVSGFNIDDAFQQAVKNNPTIKTAELNREQVNYSEDLDVSTDLPSLYLNATEGQSSPDTSSLFNGSSNYYSVGLNLTVPLFSGLSSIAKRRGYEEQKYQAERLLQIAKDTLMQALDTALHNLKAAKIQLDLAQISVKQGREALEMANKSYRQGTASSTDVINLQTTRYNAEKLFVAEQFAYLQALLTLRQQMGIDMEKAYEK